MKKSVFFLVGAILLAVSIFLLSYYSFTYFNNRRPQVDVNNLEVVFSDDGKLNLNEQVPTDDNQIDNITSYNFKIKNKSSKTVTYQLLIEDYATDSSKDLLSRKYLNYELALNGKFLKQDKLSNVKNNIIDTRTISKESTDEYELKVWVSTDVDSTEWMGKSYNYNVSINPLIN